MTLRLVSNLMWTELRFTRYPPPSLPRAQLPLSLSASPCCVARQAAASPPRSINNSAGYWLLPLRCRNILFPGWGRRRRREGRFHRGGMLRLLSKSPYCRLALLRHHHGNNLKSCFCCSDFKVYSSANVIVVSYFFL